VLDALVCGVVIVTHAGAQAGNLVGGDADADARAADEDGLLGHAGTHRVADRLGGVGIVGRLGRVDAEVDNFVALEGEMGSNFLLEEEAGVVGGDD
jgi:hypothetical protein